MSKSNTVDVALKFVEFINAQDVESLCSLMTKDFTFIDYGGTIERGKDLMRKGWVGYFTDFPKYKIHVEKVLVGGDGVAIIGKTTGSHIPPEVEEKETVLWIAEIRNGLLSEWRIYADTDVVTVGREGETETGRKGDKETR